jgi:hypothetical protein
MEQLFGHGPVALRLATLTGESIAQRPVTRCGEAYQGLVRWTNQAFSQPSVSAIKEAPPALLKSGTHGIVLMELI